ncbi:MAG: replication protein RepA [Acidimicrobiia bacterium]
MEVLRPPEAIEELLAEGDSPTTGYAARLFAQVALPYRDPGDLANWIRRNGLITLSVRPGEWLDPKTGELRHGYPYGALPRLLLTWMTTEAVRTRSRVLNLGHSLYEFTGRIGLNPPQVGHGTTSRMGGENGRRLLAQMQRLFHAPITAYDARTPGIHHSKAMLVADEGVLLFDPASPNQAALWGSTVILSERFFESVRATPVPVDLAVLARLKGSPLRLDIYTWLTYRMHYLTKPTTVPWEALAAQFGGDYSPLRAFSSTVRQAASACLCGVPGGAGGADGCRIGAPALPYPCGQAKRASLADARRATGGVAGNAGNPRITPIAGNPRSESPAVTSQQNRELVTWPPFLRAMLGGAA